MGTHYAATDGVCATDADAIFSPDSEQVAQLVNATPELSVCGSAPCDGNTRAEKPSGKIELLVLEPPSTKTERQDPGSCTAALLRAVFIWPDVVVYRRQQMRFGMVLNLKSLMAQEELARMAMGAYKSKAVMPRGFHVQAQMTLSCELESSES